MSWNENVPVYGSALWYGLEKAPKEQKMEKRICSLSENTSCETVEVLRTGAHTHEQQNYDIYEYLT